MIKKSNLGEIYPSLAFAALVVALPLNTYAQGGQVEEVVVTAEEQENAVLNDAVSVSALDGEKLAEAGIENVEDVAAYVPNLVLSETATGTNIVIRGIGAGVNQGFDQSVGLYVDNVPLPRGQMARAPFLDLAGVQVLRGPQYVRDGNYSLAGSVHMLTRQATDEFELGLELAATDTDKGQSTLLTMGLPIGDRAGLRLAVQRNVSDGYIENVARNEDGPQSDELLIRSVFSFNLTEDLGFKLKVEQGSFDTVGRQIEILASESTPNFLEFADDVGIENRSITDFGADNFGNFRGPRPSDFNVATTSAVVPQFLGEEDFFLDPIASLYNITYDEDTQLLADGRIAEFGNANAARLLDAQGVQQDFYTLRPQAFAGRSYLEVLHALYTGDNPVTGVEFGVDSEPTLFNPNGPITPPPGLLDDRVNFKRSADAEEYSNNDTINVTLNTDLNLGEHSFELTASYIDYEVVEQIDGDVTPLNTVLVNQSENYDQQFFRLDYNSPKEGFIELSLGASYLKSSLSFDQTFSISVDPGGAPVVDQASAEAFIRNPVSRATDVQFNEDFPFTGYFGRVLPLFNIPFRLYTPNRIFDQDNQISAGFLETKFNWSDSFRTVLGLRYTHSEKQAVRDFAFLLADGNPLDLSGIFLELPTGGQSITIAQSVAANAAINLGLAFNFEQHTDRIPESFANIGVQGTGISPALRGDRTEEALLPSISMEWDATPDLSLNAGVRMANKLGGFDALSLATPTVPAGSGVQPGTFEFEDEDAITYELGARWYLPQGYGEFRATAFYTDFENLQVSASDRGVGFNVQNAGSATTYGVELEGNLLFTERFTMTYSAAWIQFEFTEYPVASCPFGRRPDFVQVADPNLFNDPTLGLSQNQLLPVVYEESVAATQLTNSWFGYSDNEQIFTRQEAVVDGIFNFQRYNFNNGALPTFCDFEGQTNQYVADWQGTFTFDYEAPVVNSAVLKSTLDVIYNSGYETTVTQDSTVAQNEYFQFNGRIAFKSSDDLWELALTGENLTNEKIVLFAGEVPLSTRVQGSRTHFGFVRPPRTMGLSFTANFY